MANVTFNRSIGLLLLAIWLILYGLASYVDFVVPADVMSGLAIIAGVLILIDR